MGGEADLGKRVEDRIDLVLGDADATVLDPHLELVPVWMYLGREFDVPLPPKILVGDTQLNTQHLTPNTFKGMTGRRHCRMPKNTTRKTGQMRNSSHHTIHMDHMPKAHEFPYLVGKLCRVSKKVCEHLDKPPAVSRDNWQVSWNLVDYRHPGADQRHYHVAHALQHLVDLHHLPVRPAPGEAHLKRRARVDQSTGMDWSTET